MFTMYHNPRCSKSRQTLDLLQSHGIEPELVLYLDTPPDEQTLKALLGKLKLSARELLRKGEDAYKDNGLKNPNLPEAELIATMCQYPKLIERPIVVKGDLAVLGRPPENVLDLI